MNETGASFSPDGRWVAYSVTEDRITNTFVQPFPATGAKYVMVKSRASSPHHAMWSDGGKALIYNAGPGTIDRVTVATQPAFSFGNAQTAQRPYQGGPPGSRRLFDMMPDGRVLGLITPGQTTGVPAEEIRVVMNWFEELRARVPR